jgi:phage FluMu protein Com
MTEQAIETPAKNEVTLDEKDKRVLRCQKCGHFLAEVIIPVGIIKILCRQNPCKTYNIITINNGIINIRLEEKKDVIKY